MGIFISLFFTFILPMAAFAFLIWIFVTLQIYLSGRRIKFVGFILPILSFVAATLFSYIVWSLDGEVNTNVFLVPMIVLNIPTLIYLIIYFNVRKHLGNSAENTEEHM